MDPNVLVGVATADDAAVYRIADDLAVVLTVDFFTPIVDNPYDFGRIAVTNSLSDIYAMGARAVLALNLVGYPSRTQPLSVLEEILRGGSYQAQKAGISIAGGHSIDDPEPKYGLVVMGLVHPDKVMSNASARVGDVLFLTKPIGTGIISTAIKDGAADESVVARAVELMTTLNKAGSEAMLEVGAHACTDITGFGLLGHLSEMTHGSKVGAKISLSKVPAIEGVWDLLAQDMAPGGTERNLKFLDSQEVVVWGDDITHEEKLFLCDAQTAGPLLISTPPEKADAMEAELKAADVPVVARIGEIVDDPEGRIWVER